MPLLFVRVNFEKMRYEIPIPGYVRFCFILVAGFCFAWFGVLDLRAQPAAPSDQPSGNLPVVTNLLQLSKLLDSSPRMVAGLRLDVLVCSASRAEIGVIAVKDKTGSEILELGQRTVAITNGDIVRIEGQPARNPSFWVHNVHFVHTYQRVGQFWFASSTHSTSEVRIFGASELNIENTDYALKSTKKLASNSDSIVSMVR